MRKDIFADFLSPDNRFIYGTYANISERDHEKILRTSLNISILLTGEFLIVPPFFPFQCKIARRALAYKYEFIDDGYIVFPMRENTIDLFLEKKRTEYARVKSTYSGLYKSDGKSFLKYRVPRLIKRKIKMGATIAREWQSAPDTAISWEPIRKDLSVRKIEQLRSVPYYLKENGIAVTWAAMEEFLKKYNILNISDIKTLGTKLDEAIQFEYIKTYLDEFNATIITRIPPKTTDIFIAGDNLSYDYWMFQRIMEISGVWNIIANASAKEIIELKNSYGFIKFIQEYEQACLLLNSETEIKELYARVISQLQLNKYSLFNSTILRNLFPLNLMHFNDLFLEIAKNIQIYLDNDFQADFILNKNYISRRKIKMTKIFLVHGANTAVRDSIRLFLSDFNLEVVVMETKAGATLTLPEKFEQLAKECNYAVVIATADDNIYINGEEKTRVRQNVLIEIGFFWGRLARTGRWCLLLGKPDNLDFPSDLQGIEYIPITRDLGETKLRLQKELKEAGII